MSRDVEVYVKTDENLEQFKASLAAIFGVETSPPNAISSLAHFIKPDGHVHFELLKTDYDTNVESTFYGYQWSLWTFPFNKDENDKRDYKTLQSEAGLYVFNELTRTGRYNLLLVINSAIIIDRFDVQNE